MRRYLLPFAAALVCLAVSGCSAPGGPAATCVDDCVLPPAPFCEGDTLVSSAPLGECVDGACVFQQTRTSCEGQCSGGACIAPIDRCEGVACETPPPGRCEGDVALTAEPTGTCDPETGECAYGEQSQDCAATGLICDTGRCLEPFSPCRGVECPAQPAFCRDGELVSPDPGACDEATGECVYTEQITDCTAADPEGYCEAGRCRVPDRCAGVVCDAPPTDTCADDVTLRQSARTGRCADGDCTYATSDRSCAALGRVCRDGACVEADPCEGVVCDTPPAPSCAGTRATRWGAGTCGRDGRCTYPSVVEDCAPGGQVCVGAGVCEASACIDGCPTPEPACEGDARVTFAAGRCDEDADRCVFDETRLDCTASGRFCVDGACVEADPCRGVDCSVPPDPACRDGAALTFAPGTCEAGVCQFPATADPCSLRDATCEAGACVEPDLCAGVTCELPPEDACDGDVHIDYPDVGSCDAGDCLYAPILRDCLELPGGYCFGGACRSTDPCFGVACNDPPLPRCDLDTAVTYAADGTCGGGRCSYDVATTEDCTEIPSGFCADGACESADPCYGVSCAVAPSPVCDGEVAVTSLANGTCSGGRCLFDTVRTNCADTGRICSGGTCRSPDPCVGVLCNRPPQPYCEGTDVVIPASLGTCDDGFCSYPPTRVNCAAAAGRCLDGACVPGNPCDGVVCDDPPEPTCAAGNAVNWTQPSVCVDGDCRYTRLVDDCVSSGGSCLDGACVSIDPCDGVRCDAPPADGCDGNTALRFDPTGACGGGVCTYGSERVDCGATGQFCEAGACVDADPCQGVSCVSPPTAACAGDLLVEYGFPGECAGGECDYPSRTTNCAASGRVCRFGACVVDPICIGVDCDVPTRSFCEGNAAVTVDGAGECVDGLCSYARSTVNCAATGRFCFNGGCVDTDPCVGVVCGTAPGDVCDGNVAVIWSDGGSCLAGACSYTSRREDCGSTGRFCDDGACVDVDPCEGVTCDAPPSALCSGTTAFRYEGAGACIAGDCVWPPTVEDCAAAGQVCEDGECVEGDLCAALTCDIPPPTVCDGTEVVSYGDPARCEDEACVWTESRFDCGALGAFCSQGRCVASDPCAGVTCPLPPAPVCEDGVAVTWGAGVCAEGGCTWAATRTRCADTGRFCQLGTCVAFDPCDGVTCAAPPAPYCDGAVRVTPLAGGTCVDGVCRHSEERTICTEVPDYTCADGECVPDLCDTIGCGGPPPAYCEGNVAWTPTGDGCEENTCDWPLVSTDCASVGLICSAGRCVPDDPCDLISCSTPPPPVCADRDRLIRSSPFGACDAGVCVYAQTETRCSDAGQVCFFGMCADDPCLTTTCDTPPESVCNGDMRLDWEPVGTCDLGACDYELAPSTDCAASGRVCSDGECVVPEPCTGVRCVDPPARVCVGTRARSWQPFGVCIEGACEYTFSDTDCAATGRFCFEGACVATDPCLGVDCVGTAPLAYCEGSMRITPTGAPSCIAGECGFASALRFDCALGGQFCVDGACTDTDPCDVITCDDPPASYCDGFDLVSYAVPGYCVGGACTYRVVESACGALGLVCTGEACIADPCTGIMCPPQRPFCRSGSAVQPPLAGLCDPVLGRCEYEGAEVVVDCAGLGRVCNGGYCRAPEDAIAAGDVVLNEFLAVPASGEPAEQWIELLNRTDGELDLAGVALYDPAHGAEPFYVFPGASSLGAGEVAVVVSEAGTLGDLAPFAWGGPSVYTLPAGGGTLIARIDSTTLTSLTWGAALGGQSGRAAQLDADRTTESGVPAAWCPAGTLYDAANRGTPGAPNFACD